MLGHVDHRRLGGDECDGHNTLPTPRRCRTQQHRQQTGPPRSRQSRFWRRVRSAASLVIAGLSIGATCQSRWGLAVTSAVGEAFLGARHARFGWLGPN
jgi:hypothetical protein